MIKIQDDDIVQGMLSQDVATRNAVLELIYKKSFPMIEAFVLKNNGTHADAKDIFQDGTMIIYQNIKRGKFRGDSSPYTYLYSICRNLWLIQLKKNVMRINDNIDDNELAFEEVKQAEVNIQALKSIMLELKEDCRRMLIGFYYEMKSMTELANSFNLSSEQAAKNKKSRCLKYLSNKINQKGLSYENFVL